MNNFNHILVINRALQDCHRPIRLGISLAKKYQARLHVLHLIPNPLAIEEWGFQILPTRKDLDEIEAKTKKEFQSIMSLEKNQGFLVKEYIKKGKPAVEILDTVNRENIDLVILFAHKEGHLEHMFGSSDADKIVSKLPCSVLLLDEDEERSKRQQ